MHRRLTTATIVLLLVQPLMSRAGAGTDLLDGARRSAAALDVASASTRLSDAVLTAAELAGAQLDTQRPIPAPDPIGAIVAAARAAQIEAAAAVDSSPGELQQARGELDQLLRSPLIVTDPQSITDRTSAQSSFEQRWASLASRLDRARMLGAAYTLVTAIEANLQALADLRPAARLGGACDVVDQPPVLCVASDAPTIHVDDYMLTVDQGGDDTWLNRAGGADAAAGLPVSIAIDLGGDDTYIREDTTFAQGSSNIGIGILLDVAGKDRYSAVQGQGLGFAGVGLLGDLSGDDIYELSNDDPLEGYGAQAYGLGYAVFGAVGIVMDSSGDDDVKVSAQPTSVIVDQEGIVHSETTASGLGLGAFAAIGLAIDGGGQDRFEVIAETADLAPDSLAPRWAVNATTYGFGMGIGPFGGIGAQLTADGDTIRQMTARIRGPASSFAFTNGLGHGIGDGFGLLLDEGGNDTYEALTDAVGERTLRTSVCNCGDEITGVAGAAANYVQGSGSLAGTGLVVDRAGDDRYVAVARSRSLVRVSADRENDEVHAVSVAGASQNLAQGSSILGNGSLQDLAGDDSYETEAIVEAEARVEPAHRGEATSVAGTAVTVGQGGSAGGAAELRDLGGSDLYSSRNRTSSIAVPERERFDWGGAAAVFGSAAGLVAEAGGEQVSAGSAATFSDTDGGAVDVFIEEPAEPRCLGSLGDAVWVDCTGGVGTGAAV